MRRTFYCGFERIPVRSYSVIAISFVLLLSTAVSAQDWTEEQKLTANDAVAGIGFGDAVALGNGIAFVGATANGLANLSAGAVYVLLWNETESEWQHAAKLEADDGALDDRFGWSVSYSDGAVIIGAPDDDDNGELSGSAYVFRLNENSWVQEQKLTPDDGQANDRFGRSVAISGDVAVVGAPNAPGDGGPTGAAYIFRWDGQSWAQEDKVVVGSYTTIAGLGTSVAADGDRVLVGVPLAGPGSQNLGSAYVFKFDGEAWQQEGVLSASDQDEQDKFGSSVALDGDVALMGVPQDEDGGAFSGAAYIFRWDGEAWQEEQKLLADDPAEDDRLGSAVSLSGNVAVVGAPNHDFEVLSSGATYVFEFDGEAWTQAQQLGAGDAGIGDHFGESVAVLGEQILIGASNNDDGGESAGSAYVFAKGGTGTAAESESPASLGLSLQVYPNPFADRATITYELPGPATVRLAVYDVLGRMVVDAGQRQATAGVHATSFGAENLPSGLYLARLETEAGVVTSRLIKTR